MAHVFLFTWTPVEMQTVRAQADVGARMPLRLLPNKAAEDGIVFPPPDMPAAPSPETPADISTAQAPTIAPAQDSAMPQLPLPWVPPADDDYLPRSKLSAQPEPLAPIAIANPDPALMTGVTRQRLVLTLFIGPSGLVERIRVDEGESGPVSAALEAAARDAFFTARFTPGEVDGLPVRSRMRIEVIVE